MKVKKLIELLKDFKPESEISFIDFDFISKGSEKVEYEIEWLDKIDTIYTNGYGTSQECKVFLNRKRV